MAQFHLALGEIIHHALLFLRTLFPVGEIIHHALLFLRTLFHPPDVLTPLFY